MNFAPKAGPLVAELLSGVSFLLILYVNVHGVSFAGIDALSSGAIVVLVTLGWLLGTFFDLCRNLLEWIWDHFSDSEVNWRFFFDGKQEHLENLERYFWSFYMLDADMAISIVLSLAFGPVVSAMATGKIRWSVWPIWVSLLIIAGLFALDAGLLRREVKGLVYAKDD